MDSCSYSVLSVPVGSQSRVVVTGAARGIGAALARGFVARGVRDLVVADRDLDLLRAVADEVGATAVEFDAGDRASVTGLVTQSARVMGGVDVFCSNVGVAGSADGVRTSDTEWDLLWRVNVLSHVWAADALLPQVVDHGGGRLVITASAAGLLTQVSALAYTATKHAAVAVAEWLAIRYGDVELAVSCVCPQAVQTEMLDLAMADPVGAATVRAGGVLSPGAVATAVIAGIDDGRFLILPHPDVAWMSAAKATDRDAWVVGMRRSVLAGQRDAAQEQHESTER